MPYRDSLAALAAVADGAGVEGRVERPDGAALAGKADWFGDGADDIAAAGWFASDDLPWVAEHLVLYGFADLDARQRGYRSDARTGEPVPGWQADMRVIGDALADPLCIAGDGSIHVSTHGAGRRVYRPVFPDLSALYDFLASWVRLVVLDRKGAIHAPDFEVLPAVKDAVARAAAAGATAAMQANWLAFMFD